MNNKGQVTIFIIIAILIIAAVGSFFVFKDKLISKNIPSDFEEVYNNFLFCLEEDLSTGINVLESQGGYIYLPEFEAGSEQYPFSSQLNFLGNPIPYWYYVSGNGFEEEQIPTNKEMESQLETFIESKVSNCFESYEDEGFEISMGEPKANVNINSKKVVLDLDMDFSIAKDDESTVVNSHEVVVNSYLGLIYDSAKEVYRGEQKNLFLENYTIDILNSYAPVDGVEFSCAPEVWSIYDVFGDVQEAVVQNLAVVKTEGNSDDYFVVETLLNKISNDISVDFRTSLNWPSTFEINPSQGPLLIANPVGNELGLGSLGFCYIAYHFVYDYKYSVMVQLKSETTGEIFQFPIAVVIEGTNPRKSLSGEISSEEEIEICENANTEVEVFVRDSNSNYVDAGISFECMTQTCDIGTAENGVLSGLFPQCVNGFVIAQAEGYEDASVQFSTVEQGTLTIFMDKLYEVDLDLQIESSDYNGEALIIFENSEGNSKSVLYPSQKTVELSAGTYDISVSAYTDVSLELGSTTQEFCTEVPRAIVGVLGLTKEECYEVEVPEQLISKALSGGGTAEYTFSENGLKYADGIVLNAEKFPEPDSLIQIQENYILLENKNLEVSLR